MAEVAKPVPTEAGPTSITIVSHSTLLYWWPVWAVGLVFGCLSLFDGYRLGVFPEGTKLEPASGGSGTYTLTVPGDHAEALPTVDAATGSFPVRVAGNKYFGLIFCLVLLLVIFGTNVHLRGLWSVITLMGLVIVAILGTWFEWWQWLVWGLGRTHIYISAIGYLLVSVVLLVMWVLAVFVYDRNRYVTFSPGQLIVRQEVGDVQQVYDTISVSIEKEQSDLFRHLLLGFFSGDVVIRISGAQARRIEMPNVLMAGSRVQQVADLMATRTVTQAEQ
jgi:hypothetical protein